MEEILKSAFLQAGFAGVLIVVLCGIAWLLLKKQEQRDKDHKEERQDHKKERQEWKEEAGVWRASMAKLTEDGNKSRDRNTEVLSELKILIQSTHG